MLSIQPSSIPHLKPLEAASRPAKSIIRTMRGGETSAAPPTTTSKPVLHPSDTEKDAETTDSGPVKSGNVKTEDKPAVSKMFLLQENQASSKSPQVEPRVEFNNLQPLKGDREESEEVPAELRGLKPEETPNMKSDSEPKEASETQEKKNLNPESVSRSEAEGKVPSDVNRSLRTEDQNFLQPSTGSESKMVRRLTSSDIQSLESNSSSRDEEEHPESDSASEAGDRRKAEIRTLESELRPREEEEEKKKEVKNGGAKKQPLR